MLTGWLVVIGGLLWGYQGLTGTNLLTSFGSLEQIIEVIVGLSALYVGYMMLNMKKK